MHFYLVWIFLYTAFSIMHSMVMSTRESTSFPLLTFITMDGFRYDYLEKFSKQEVPHFYQLIENGAKATHVHNVFPSVTLPSHMTLLTGLYPEHHGVVHNRFYDPLYNRSYDLFDFKANEDPRFFDNGQETIWVTNQKSSPLRNSGSVIFPAAVTAVKGIIPRVIPNAFYYNESITWEARVDTLIQWFTDKYRPINLGLLYFQEPDETGHAHGPDITKDGELHKIIIKLDGILGYLLKKLKDTNLLDKMNIILTADHGMVQWNGQKVNLDTMIDRNLYTMAAKGKNHLVELIYPKEGSANQILAALKKSDKIHVYRKGSKEAEKIHYSQNRRIPEIIVEAKKGYVIGINETLVNFKTKGIHGYDPSKVDEVHPFFIASGPVFKKNHVSGVIKMVDIYSLMCHVLKIVPAANDGSLESVLDLLSDSEDKSLSKAIETTSVTFLVVVLFAALVSGIFCIGAFRQNRITARKRKILGRPRMFDFSTRSRDTPDTSALLQSDDDDL